jgi:polar amino acid transport system permease protein
MFWNWDYTWEILPILATAAITTVQATVLGFAIASVFGLVIAILCMANKVIAWPLSAVVEIVRSTPLLIQIFFIFFVLPRFGVTLDAFTAGVLALGLHYGAYCSEVYRAGIESVPRGQWEASTALNLGLATTFKDVILPQAIPPIVPALGNYLIGLFKQTPLLSAIGVLELMQRAKLIGSESFRYVEPITLVGILFLVMSLASAGLIQCLEGVLRKKFPR